MITESSTGWRRHDSSQPPEDPADRLPSPALHELLADVIQRDLTRCQFVEELARRAQIFGHDADWYIRIISNPFLAVRDRSGLLKVVSMGSIEGTGEDQAIMWRGFMLNRAVQHSSKTWPGATCTTC